MKQIDWKNICLANEYVHVATIETGRMVTPAIHRHDFYECFLVLSGTGWQQTPAGDSPLDADRLYFVRPEHAHAIKGSTTAPLFFINMAFEENLFEAVSILHPFPETCWEKNAPIRSLPMAKEQLQNIRKLGEAIAAQKRDRLDAAWLLLSLNRCLRDNAEENVFRTDCPDWLSQVLATGLSPDQLRTGLPALIALCGRSQGHLNRSFKEKIGKTPTRWINEQRIQHACLLLHTTRLSVLEVALDCGFESLSHFHKQFKKMTEMTPGAYRKQMTHVQFPV